MFGAIFHPSHFVAESSCNLNVCETKKRIQIGTGLVVRNEIRQMVQSRKAEVFSLSSIQRYVGPGYFVHHPFVRSDSIHFSLVESIMSRNCPTVIPLNGSSTISSIRRAVTILCSFST